MDFLKQGVCGAQGGAPALLLISVSYYPSVSGGESSEQMSFTNSNSGFSTYSI